jgi:glycosidase
MQRCFAVILAVLASVVTGIQPAGAQAAPRDTSWVGHSALYEVFVQDFSARGDFRGVIEGLARIQATGANVVWLMPIHPIGVKNRKGTLGSPYAALDYKGINPSYGSAADLKALVQAAHARGMKVILDWVPDHTSPDNPWVRDHPDFYFKNDQGEPSVPRDKDGKLTDWDDVVQLDYGNPALRREMTATMRWWLEEFSLDGFRVDVAGFIPYDYWRELIPVLRSAVPRQILMLAEWDDPELIRCGYDLIYAWDPYHMLKKIWKGAPARELVELEVADRRAMPPGGMRMRFSTNHDLTAWDDPPTALFSAGAGTRAAFTAMALLPGRPLLYNGQEVESPQKLPLFERMEVVWNQPGGAEALAFYRRVIDLARTEPALLGTDLAGLETSAPDDVIAYRRGNLAILVNARARPVRLTVAGLRVDGALDLLTKRALKGRAIALPPYGVVVLKPAAD